MNDAATTAVFGLGPSRAREVLAALAPSARIAHSA